MLSVDLTFYIYWRASNFSSNSMNISNIFVITRIYKALYSENVVIGD